MNELASDAARRLARGDVRFVVGGDGPTRDGWINHYGELTDRVAALQDTWFVRRAPRHEHTLLIAMGGSSSGSAMLAGALGGNRLSILDTSNPDTIASTTFDGVNVLVGSKSGSTIETVAAMAWALGHGLDPRDLTVLTDAGTSLEELARSLGAAVIHGDPNCGGRYSALGPFGLLPALAGGVNGTEIVESAGEGLEPDELVQWFLDAVNAVSDHDQLLTLDLGGPPTTMSRELWLEQLVAESTGKEGRGVLPTVGHASVAKATLPERATFARDIFRWHVQTVGYAFELDVNPFDQPDVEDAKHRTFANLQSPTPWSSSTTITPHDLELLDAATYVTIQLFGPTELESRLEALRVQCSSRWPIVTAGLGPRFMHSSGQLHKGGPAGVVSVQLVIRPQSEPIRIPGRGYSFHDLHVAQARADAAALRARDRHVIELYVESMDEADQLLGALPTMAR